MWKTYPPTMMATSVWSPSLSLSYSFPMSDLILETFQSTKSHSIERDGKKSNRGWRKVRLIPSEMEEAG